MRKVKYICDCCGKEYPYELTVKDNDRGVLLRIPELGVEICRKCKLRVKEFIDSITYGGQSTREDNSTLPV